MNYETKHHIRLTEPEIRSFLQERPRRFQFDMGGWLVPTVLGVLVLGFMLLNATALLRSQTPIATASEIVTPTIAPAAPTPATVQPAVAAAATPAPTPSQAEAPVSTIPNDSLNYGDLSIAAPITWDVALNSKNIYTILQNGLVHVQGTAKPGEKGNVVLLGHSSNYPWIKSDYNSIFAPLVHSKSGQVVQVAYNGIEYRYRVDASRVVNPNNLGILNASGGSTLTLITCVPIGTSTNRLIITATQISPDSAQNASFNATNFSGQLPGDQ